MTVTPAGSAAVVAPESGRTAPRSDGPSADPARIGIGRILRQLHDSLNAQRSVFYFADPSERTLTVGATAGASADDFRALYGRGVAGRTAESGCPVVVPAVAHEPMALLDMVEPNKWRQENLSLVCVPVLIDERSAGVLAIYFIYEPDGDFSVHLRHLRVAAARVAELVKASRRVQSTAPEPARPTEAPSPYEYSNFIGSSAVMRQLYEQVSQVARTTATVLIRGESGTGKELVAQAIHHNSVRAGQSFVKVNCAAIPETLFESELFGHERGAFTGAHCRKIGRFELAQGGTLFLDELGELPVATQVKLLRVLQSREFERLGGTGTLRTDVRLIAATNKDLERAVADGSFREDLYYRLNVFTISVPPLRDRPQDIPALAQYFVRKFAAEHGRPVSGLHGAALDTLCQHDWPGNVRELENAIERAIVVCDATELATGHLPDSVRRGARPAPARKPTLAAAVEELERAMIAQALEETRGNLARAARALGATERVIRYKAGKYGLQRSSFRK